MTSFAHAPGDDVQPGDATTTETESSRPSQYISCDTACWTCGCGTVVNNCTGPGYNC